MLWALGGFPSKNWNNVRLWEEKEGALGAALFTFEEALAQQGNQRYRTPCYFFSLNGQIYIICSALSIQINVKICFNCAISPLLSMMRGNQCYVLNFHQLALALDSFTFLVLLQVSFTIPLNPPDICSFGLLVCFLINNPSFQVYRAFSVWWVPTITLETTYFWVLESSWYTFYQNTTFFLKILIIFF